MKALKLALALALLVSISFAYTADDFFVSLDNSYIDLTYGWAEFSYYNAEPMDKAASASTINFVIQQNSTAITSQKLYLWSEVTTNVPVYATTTIKKNCTTTDNKTGEKITYDCSYSFTNKTGTKAVSSWQWVLFKGDALKPGVKYKVKVEATWKPKLGKVSMDWVPYTKTATAATLYQSKWAWWNVTWANKQEVNISGNATWLRDEPITLNITGNVNSNCYDIRIVNEVEDSLVPYELISNSTGRCEVLWYANESKYYAYYNNPSATNVSTKLSYLNWTTNLKGIYLMNETSGALKDYTGGTYWGTAGQTGTVPYSTGLMRGARGVFSNTQYFSITGKSLPAGTDTFSITMWVKVNATPTGDQYFISQDTGGGNTYAFWLGYLAGDHWRFGQAASGAPINCDVSKYDTLIVGNWYFLTFYHDGSTGSCNIAVNDSAYTTAGGGTQGSVGNDMGIGIVYPGVNTPLDKFNLEQIAIWNKALTTDERLWLWNNGRGKAFPQGVSVNLGGEEINNQILVNQIYPNNGITNTTNNIYFGYNVASVGTGPIDSCSLYTNESGWGITSLNASQVINNSINAFNHQFANAGQYLWAVQCQAGTNITTTANRTLTLTEYSNSYVPAVYELVKTPHNITFTFSNYTYASVGLVWGGSYMPATQVAANVWAVNVTPPLILTNNTAVNFNWNYTRTNSSVSQAQSTPTQSQSVYYAYTLSVASISPLTASEGQTLVGDLQIANVSSLASITAWFNGVFGAYRGFNGTLNYNQTVIATGGPAIPYSVNYTWVANISYGGNTRTMSLTTPNVSIYNLIVTACGDGNATAVVWTPYDTRTGQVLNASFNVILLLYNSGAARQYSFSISNANNFSVCIYPSTITYLANISMQYVANNYQQGTWYASGFVLNNATKYLSVYLINTTNAYLLDFTVVDQYNTRVANTYVYFQRFNYTSSSWYNETIVHTSEGGAGSVIVERYTVPYKVVIYGADGTTVLTTYDNYYISTSPVTFVTTRTFNNIYAIIQDISHSCNYDTGTKVLTCTYSDPHNALSYTNFTVTTAAGASVCNAGSPLAGYTYTCDVNAYPNTTGFNFIVTVNVQGYTATLDQGNINPATIATLGNNGLLLALFIIIPLFFIGAFKPMLAIILADLGFFVSTIFGYINLGPAGGLTMGVLVGLSALILWRMRE